MDLGFLTEERIVYFFNKYKNNFNQIFVLERTLLNESCESLKWEIALRKNSNLTRQLYIKNEALIEAYVKPAIEHPELLKEETIRAFLLHITFFLFENNIDLLITEELLNSFLAHPEILNKNTKFSALMNLGIARTISIEGTFEETQKIFEDAISIFKNLEEAGNDDTRIHIVFCRVYQMLSFDLYNSSDYKSFIKIYNATKELLNSGSNDLYAKMWGKSADYDFHIEYLLRFLRIYGIFMAGRTDFSSASSDDEENKQAADIIIDWLIKEFSDEKKEGKVNLMIFTYFYKYEYLKNKISREDYKKILNEKFIVEKENHSKISDFIFPELAFPDDNDPIDPLFSNMLDKMKLFNKTFSYTYIFLIEYYKIEEDNLLKKDIINEIMHYYETSKYAEKGFILDKFEIEILRTLSPSFDSINDFLLFFQTVLIHRQISTANHIGMVSSIAGVCFYHFISKKPELFFIPGKVETVEDIEKNKWELLNYIKQGAFLHDIGKLNMTALINLHARKITDREYSIIKSHSSMGWEIVKGIPYLELYKGFILGHHKFWNDKGGYPKSFKIQESQLKYYIGLLTLADCIDTATDTEGRNYARKKTFDDLLKELVDSAGERYCPELVDLLYNDEELKNQLRKITTEGRKLNLKKTYLSFLEKNIHFSEEEEKVVSVLNDVFYNKLPNFYKNCYPKISEEKIISYTEDLTSGNKSRVFILHDKTNKIYGVLCGYIHIPIDNSTKIFNVTDFLILPNYRRKGLGTFLLVQASRLMKVKDVSKIRISLKKGVSEEAFFWISGFSKYEEYQMELTI